MGRERYGRRDNEPLLATIARRTPRVGLIVGAALCCFGLLLAFVLHEAIPLGWLVGLLIGVIGLAVVVRSAIGILWEQLSGSMARAKLGGRAWTIEAVQALSWREFEALVADLYRRQGFVVEETGKQAMSGRGDGGVDLVLSKPAAGQQAVLVQCKQYKAWDVGEPRVREFFGAMAAWKTRCEGIMVTCGRYSGPAKEFARDKPLRLVDGEALLEMLNRQNELAPAVERPLPEGVAQASAVTSAGAAEMSPSCPRCGGKMVKRTAGRGERAGQAFWGCAKYPGCRGIVNIGQ
jgi:restriction system protein